MAPKNLKKLVIESNELNIRLAYVLANDKQDLFYFITEVEHLARKKVTFFGKERSKYFYKWSLLYSNMKFAYNIFENLMQYDTERT